MYSFKKATLNGKMKDWSPKLRMPQVIKDNSI